MGRNDIPGIAATFECTICQEDVPCAESTQVEPCGHRSFCAGCIRTWLTYKTSCPLCRTEVLRTCREGESETGVPAWNPVHLRNQNGGESPSPRGFLSLELSSGGAGSSRHWHNMPPPSNIEDDGHSLQSSETQQAPLTDDEYYDEFLADQLERDVEEGWQEDNMYQWR
jgi:hypothetical protein